MEAYTYEQDENLVSFMNPWSRRRDSAWFQWRNEFRRRSL